MSTEPISRDPGSCSYCGSAIDLSLYFCPSCAKPHCSIEQVITPSLPAYADNETKLRTGSREAWNVFFIFLSIIVVTSFIGVSIWGHDNLQPTFLLADAAIILTTVIFSIRYWHQIRPLMGRLGFNHAAAWIGLAGLAPLLLLNYGYHHLLESLGVESLDYNAYFTTPAGPILFICILPAITEEIAFRGIIQDQFEKVVSPAFAIAVASLAFSAAHFSPLSAPYLALVGALLGWMKWKTGSLYPAMLAHFAHNYIVITWF